MSNMIRLPSGIYISQDNYYFFILNDFTNSKKNFSVTIETGNASHFEFFDTEAERQHFAGLMYRRGIITSQRPALGASFKPGAFFINTKMLLMAKMIEVEEGCLGVKHKRISLYYPTTWPIYVPDLPTAEAEALFKRIVSGG